MPASPGLTLASGFAFGSALAISGVANPRIIQDQFNLTNFHMLSTFLTASATSAVAFTIYDSKTGSAIGTRQPSSKGWFGKYDGNIIGGSLVGAGMALTGACPGTLLVQLATGTPGSLSMISYTLLAGISYVAWKNSRLLSGRSSETVSEAGEAQNGQCSKADGLEPQKTLTVMDATKQSRIRIITVYEVLLGLVIASISLWAPASTSISQSISGGLAIGLAQICSIILRNQALGVSTAFEDLGRTFWNWINWDGKPVNLLTPSVVFGLGIVAGAKAMFSLSLIPFDMGASSSSGSSEWYVQLIGAFCLVIGSRIGGGCTSGHGISGMSGMSLSSIISTASLFGTALVTSSVVS